MNAKILQWFYKLCWWRNSLFVCYWHSHGHFWISTIVFVLFGNNHMKANPRKCHLLLSFKCPEVASINGIQITSSTAETPLCIAIDFENHLPVVCNKVSRKHNALGRIANYMSLEKHWIVMKTLIEFQFNYCPLIWMFHSRIVNNKVKRLH